MCGIGGYMCSEGGTALSEQVHAINQAQAHRGPDDEGLWVNGAAGLGSRRLAILDLSPAGHMPMLNEDGSLVITFNGEIYNSPDLRSELEAKGHRFRSRSDTEVLLRLYEEYGAECLGRLRGMFAFAIYDRKQAELFLARDPFGIKPLVYAELPGAFLFASELKALLQMPGFPRSLDWSALSLYLLLNFIPAPWTIWQSARRLPPGHLLRVRDGKVVECRRYFFLRPEPWKGDEQEAIGALHAALRESVRLHLLADVPVGVFLSGGLDSSLIAALAQEGSGKPVQSFTVTFPDFPSYDESRYARRMAEHLGVPNQEVPVSAREAKETADAILDHLDEPFADPSLVPSAILSRFTRGQVKVALSGDGGDELFAGYNRYQGLYYASRLAPVGPLIRALARAPLPESRASSIGSRWRRFQKFARIVGSSTLESHIRVMEVFQPDALREMLRNSQADGEVLLRETVGGLLEEGRAAGLNGLDRVCYADAHFVLPYDMLHKVDTASMRYSLEVRVPLVDPQVASLAFSFPQRFKIRAGQRKWVLRKVAERYFPAALLARPKGGFDIPLGEWMRGELAQTFQEVLPLSPTAHDGFFEPKAVQTLFREHVQGRRDRFAQLWNLYVFEHWRHRWRPTL